MARAGEPKQVTGPARLRAIANGPAAAPLVAVAGSAACWLAVAVGGPSRAVAWLLVGLLPGLALSPFLPAAFRRSSASGLATVVIASGATWLLVVPTLSHLGIAIDRDSLPATALLIAIAAAAAAVRWGHIPDPSGTQAGDWLGLGACLAIAGAIAGSVASNPPLGSDWGHYWKFADGIAASGTLSVLNPTWMGGGLPFGDYPGIPSLMAAWMVLAGLDASATANLIGVLYCFGVAATWLAARAHWGGGAAALAGAGAALMPATIVVLGWSGLALSLSVVFALPLAAAVVSLLEAEGAERSRLAAATAVLASCVVASQPITAMIVGLGLTAFVAGRLVVGRARAWRGVALAAGLTAVAVVAVLIDYRNRIGKLGVEVDPDDMLVTRISWAETLTSGLLPGAVVALALAGFVAAVVTPRTRPLAIAGLAVIAAALLYSESWRIGIAGEYRRAIAVLSPFLALGFGALSLLGARLPTPARLVAAAIVIGGVWLSVSSWPADLDDFYRTASPRSAQAAQTVGRVALLGKTSLVTDSCWSFPALGLTNAPIFAALDPSLIGPASEKVPAAKARAILAGSRGSNRVADDLRVAWSLVDPRCGTVGESLRDPVPPGFRAVFRSERLVIGRRVVTIRGAGGRAGGSPGRAGR